MAKARQVHSLFCLESVYLVGASPVVTCEAQDIVGPSAGCSSGSHAGGAQCCADAAVGSTERESRRALLADAGTREVLVAA